MKTFIFVLTLFAFVSQVPHFYESWRLASIRERLIEMVESEKKTLPKGLNVYTVLTDISIEEENVVNYEFVTSLYAFEHEGEAVKQTLLDRFQAKMSDDEEIRYLVEIGLEYRYVFRDRHGVTVLETSLDKDDLN